MDFPPSIPFTVKNHIIHSSEILADPVDSLHVTLVHGCAPKISLPITPPVCAEMQSPISSLHYQSVSKAGVFSWVWLHFPPAPLVLPVNPTPLSPAQPVSVSVPAPRVLFSAMAAPATDSPGRSGFHSTGFMEYLSHQVGLAFQFSLFAGVPWMLQPIHPPKNRPLCENLPSSAAENISPWNFRIGLIFRLQYSQVAFPYILGLLFFPSCTISNERLCHFSPFCSSSIEPRDPTKEETNSPPGMQHESRQDFIPRSEGSRRNIPQGREVGWNRKKRKRSVPGTD